MALERREAEVNPIRVRVRVRVRESSCGPREAEVRQSHLIRVGFRDFSGDSVIPMLGRITGWNLSQTRSS